MLKHIFASALLAGAAAGLIAALLQLVFVQPVLLHAELYEGGEIVHFTGEAPAGGHSHSHASHSHAEDADPAAALPDEALATPAQSAEPVDIVGIDPLRDGMSILFTIFVYAGYGLILVAAMALAANHGHLVTGARQGLLWGLAGFIAVQFAPAAGLPPELPGMSAADVGIRQLWWTATVVASAIGLWLLVFGQGWPAWGAAIILLALPHLIGAPHPDGFEGPTPPELASLFAGRALAVGLVGWLLLGLFAAKFWSRERVAA